MNEPTYHSVKEFLIPDSKGIPAYLLTFFHQELKQFLIDENDCIKEEDRIYLPGYNSSLYPLDLMSYPGTRTLINTMLDTPFESPSFRNHLEQLIIAVRHIPGAAVHYFPEEVLDNNVLNKSKYELLMKFRSEAEGFRLNEKLNQPISSVHSKDYYWFMCIQYRLQMKIKNNIVSTTQKDFSENITAPNIKDEFIANLDSSNTFYKEEDVNYAYTDTLYIMCTRNKPVLFFIIRK